MIGRDRGCGRQLAGGTEAATPILSQPQVRSGLELELPGLPPGTQIKIKGLFIPYRIGGKPCLGFEEIQYVWEA